MKKLIKIGAQFSGVGAFDQALKRLNIEYENIYQADWDKYARQTYLHNYEEPIYYIKDVHDTPTQEITEKYGSLDIAMFSPPCQAFSLAGKRLGKDDKRGILFFNSYEFIQINKPRYFIFENVKGLLSDDGGKTFSEWVNMLGGKSVNGNPVIFPYEESVPYHIYWKVLNAKDYGVPQNRERVFIIGIRDDEDNNFNFPKEEYLTKRLKDILEDEVDKKYYLSDKLLSWITKHREKRDSSNKYPLDENDIGYCIAARYGKNGAEDPYIKQDIITHEIPEIVRVRKYEVDIPKLQECLKNHKQKSIKQITKELNVNKTTVEHWFRTDKYFSIPDAEIWFELKKCLNIETDEFDLSITEFIEKEGVFEKSNRVYDENGIAPTMTSTSADEKILTQSPKINNKEEKIIINDKDNTTNVIGNLSGGKWDKIHESARRIYDTESYAPAIHTMQGGNLHPKILQVNESKESNGKQPYQHNRVYDSKGIMTTLDTDSGRKSVMVHNCITEPIADVSSKEYIDSCKKVYSESNKIRRLTPRECFRLMDFPDTFDFSVVSDSQSYKQAGNSIVVAVLAKIISKLKL